MVARGIQATRIAGRHLPVSGRWSSLVFLQSATDEGRESIHAGDQTHFPHESSELLGFYEISFADGLISSHEIRYDENTGEVGTPGSITPYYLTRALTAGKLPDGRKAVVWASEWVNPSPDVPIASVSLVGSPGPRRRARSCSALPPSKSRGWRITGRAAAWHLPPAACRLPPAACHLPPATSDCGLRPATWVADSGWFQRRLETDLPDPTDPTDRSDGKTAGQPQRQVIGGRWQAAVRRSKAAGRHFQSFQTTVYNGLMREGFRRFAHLTSNAAGSAWAFLGALALIVIWAAAGPFSITRTAGSCGLTRARRSSLSSWSLSFKRPEPGITCYATEIRRVAARRWTGSNEEW